MATVYDFLNADSSEVEEQRVIRVAGTTGDVLTLQANGTVSPAPGGGSQPIILTSTTVTTAQLLAYDQADDTTWPVILPALTGRNYYLLQNSIAHYRAGATPFDADASSVELYNTDQNGAIWAQGAAPLPLTSADDQYSTMAPLPLQLPAASYEAVPLILYLGTFASNAGNGSLVIRTVYSVIDGAP